jgi:hypothetical protein
VQAWELALARAASRMDRRLPEALAPGRGPAEPGLRAPVRGALQTDRRSLAERGPALWLGRGQLAPVQSAQALPEQALWGPARAALRMDRRLPEQEQAQVRVQERREPLVPAQEVLLWAAHRRDRPSVRVVESAEGPALELGRGQRMGRLQPEQGLRALAAGEPASVRERKTDPQALGVERRVLPEREPARLPEWEPAEAPAPQAGRQRDRSDLRPLAASGRERQQSALWALRRGGARPRRAWFAHSEPGRELPAWREA